MDEKSVVFIKLLVAIVSCFVYKIECYSYNINARTIYTPKEGSANNHSFFGYTVLLRAGSSQPLIIVGAPQDSSQFINHKSITDPGAIYYCQFSEDKREENCIQKILDTTGNVKSDHGNSIKAYHHRKDNMWLGMSMDGSTNNNGTVVMCAPRWINQLHPNFYLANGLCYSLPDTKQPLKPIDTNTLIPLINRNDQGYYVANPEVGSVYGNQAYYYAYGQAGISTKLSDDGTELLIGAPGVFVWKGTVIRIKISKKDDVKNYFITRNIPNPHFTQDFKDGDYLGYAVGLGKFDSIKRNLYVAGAPRGGDLKGEVLLFDFPASDSRRYIILAKFEGKQLGEYFGSVIATIDINQDGLTDLLIGAPMHSQPFMWDQGKVYVYMNRGNYQFVEQDANICGSFREGGRFGSAISDIGDINGDGFIDVAIGSPYEDYGQGAVYIYLGSENGLNPFYTQRIVVDKTTGFGISISKGVDIDQNTCNDIAIGAYTSAKVILLRCHPTVQVVPRIETFPSELSLNITSFEIQICLTFIGKESFTTDVNVKLMLDINYRRASFENRTSNSLTISGKGQTESCQVVLAVIDPKNADFSRPIDIKLTYDLKRNPMKEATFCPGCTVLKPFDKKELAVQIPFSSGCSDLICHPDLKLQVDLMADSPYTIGSSSSISLNITLENIGEPAFLAQIKLVSSSKTSILKVPSQCSVENDNEIICDFENLMQNLTKKSILLEFDTTLLNVRDEIIWFNTTATSGGEEITPDDNNVYHKLSLAASSKVEVIGIPKDNQYFYIQSDSKSDDNTSITHVFNIVNDGPTSVEKFAMMFYLPVAFYDVTTNTNYSLMKVIEPFVHFKAETIICNALTGSFYENIDTGFSIDITNDTNEDTADNQSNISPTSTTTASITSSSSPLFIESASYTDERNFGLDDILFNNSTEYENYININCSDKNYITCMVISCVGNSLIAKSDGVYISLKMLLNSTNIAKVINRKKLGLLTTFASAKSDDKNSAWTSAGFASTVIVDFETTASTPIWIIILSIILGILILSIIIGILYKHEFFKRKTKEDLALLKNQIPADIDTDEEQIDNDDTH